MHTNTKQKLTKSNTRPNMILNKLHHTKTINIMCGSI